MNIQKIKQLAEQSKGPVDMGEYANKRAAWAYDTANSDCDGQTRHGQMWWGQEQPYYKFIYLIAKEHPGLYLEIGTHQGIGFACAAAGNADSLDPNKGYTIGIDINNFDKPIETAKIYKRTTFVNGPSILNSTINQVEKICKQTDLKIGIIFIDACHKKSWVETEIKAYKHLFADEIIIMMDDIIFADNNTYLAPMFHELPGQKITFPNLHTDNRVGVILTSRQEYINWDPGIYSPEDMERGYRLGYKPSITSWGDGYK